MKNLLLGICAMLAMTCAAGTAHAQAACTSDEAQALITCVADNLTTCLALPAVEGCTEDDLNNTIAADTLGERIDTTCCAKRNKGQRTACFIAARNLMKSKGAGTLYPTDVKTAVLASINARLAEVRANGECTPAS